MNIKSRKRIKYNAIIFGSTLFIGFLLGLIEAVGDVFLFENFNYENLFKAIFSNPDSHHIMIRGLYIIFALISGFIFSLIFHKNQKLKSLLDHSAETLKIIKKINHIILYENNLKILIEKTCKTLIETGGFDLVSFIDANGELLAWSGSDSKKPLIQDIQASISNKILPKCIKTAFLEKKTVIQNADTVCVGCGFNTGCTKTTLISVPLIFNENNYGMICAFSNNKFSKKNEEFKLIENISEDMALALHLMESESNKKEFQRKWSTLIETTSDAVVTFNTDGKITGWNPGAEKLTGYSEDEIIGTNIKNIQPENFMTHYKNFINNYFSSDSSNTYETQIISKFRKKIPVEATISFKKGKKGKIDEISGILRDITIRKKTESELAITKERLELAMDAGEHGFWDWNLETNEIYFSPGFFHMLDYPCDELPMEIESWFYLIHPKDKKIVIPKINEAISKASPYEINFRMLSKFRGWRWISCKIKAFETDNQETPLRVIGVHVDITREKKLEKLFKKVKTRLDLIILGTTPALWDWNLSTGELFINQKWADMVGYKIDDLKPLSIETCNNLCHPGDLKPAIKAIQEHFNGRTDFFKCIFRMKHKKGHWVLIQSHGKIVATSHNGSPSRVAGVNSVIKEKISLNDENINDGLQVQEKIKQTNGSTQKIPTQIHNKAVNQNMGKKLTKKVFVEVKKTKNMADKFIEKKSNKKNQVLTA